MLKKRKGECLLSSLQSQKRREAKGDGEANLVSVDRKLCRLTGQVLEWNWYRQERIYEFRGSVLAV